MGAGAALLILLTVSTPLSSYPQTRAYIDAGISHARPPAGVEADAATYLQLGGRFRVGPAFAAAFGGLAVNSEAADWIGGAVGGQLRTTVARNHSALLSGVISAFSVGEPHRYDAVTARLIPEARLTAGPSTVVVRGFAGLGRSEVEDRRLTPPAVFEADLWMYGAGLEISRPLQSVQVWAGGEAYNTGDGAYAAGYVGSGGALGRSLWSLQLKLWDTPADTEFELDFAINVPLATRWSATVEAGRSGPEPLLNSPAGVDGNVHVTWTVLAPAVPLPVYTVGDSGTDGVTQVTFRLAEGNAGEVSVLGDFSGWEPIPLRREGRLWIARVPVEPGLYHFGFLVDGVWQVPGDAPGQVTDEFGRVNATLIVPVR